MATFREERGSGRRSIAPVAAVSVRSLHVQKWRSGWLITGRSYVKNATTRRVRCGLY